MLAVALTVGSTVTAAPAFAACQASQPGCVLPVADVPPPVPTAETPPPPVAEAAPIAEAAAGGGGIGLIPILVALGLLGVASYFLFFDDDEEPITP